MQPTEHHPAHVALTLLVSGVIGAATYTNLVVGMLLSMLSAIVIMILGKILDPLLSRWGRRIDRVFARTSTPATGTPPATKDPPT